MMLVRPRALKSASGDAFWPLLLTSSLAWTALILTSELGGLTNICSAVPDAGWAVALTPIDQLKADGRLQVLGSWILMLTAMMLPLLGPDLIAENKTILKEQQKQFYFQNSAFN